MRAAGIRAAREGRRPSRGVREFVGATRAAHAGIKCVPWGSAGATCRVPGPEWVVRVLAPPSRRSATRCLAPRRGQIDLLGKHRDTDFWVENASVKWKEEEAPFHTVARLTLLSKSKLQPEATNRCISMSRETHHQTARPSGASIAPAGMARLASRQARMAHEQHI